MNTKIILILFLLLMSCKPAIIRNYKVVEYKVDKRRIYYTDTIVQTKGLDSLEFKEIRKNKYISYKLKVNDVKVFEKK